jgi:hypothetical protein
MPTVTKVYDLYQREESARRQGCKHPAADRRVLIPFSTAALREPKQADVQQECALGFRTDNRASRQADQVQAKSYV